MSNKSAKAGGVPHDVVIAGGGSAGIATAASLLKRRPDLDILVIEPLGGFFGARAAKVLANKEQLFGKVFAVIVASVGLFMAAQGIGSP